MAVSQLSQKDYLKKYLSSNADDKRKRKKKKLLKATNERFRVVDDDIDLNDMRPLDEDELDLYHLSEDAPQIAGIIDERPECLRALEEFRGTRKWRIMSDENGIGDIKVTAIGNVDKQAVTGSLRNHGKSDLSPQRGHDSARGSKNTSSKHPDSESSPVRKCQDDSDASPPRKSRTNSDSDISPPRKLQAKRGLGELQSRRNKEENDSDSSPPRKHKNGSALSPKRSDVEVSPLRKEKSKRDLSPVRRSKGDASLSAVKRSNRDVDLSPVRKSKYGTDLSPARESKSEEGKHASALRNAKYVIESPRKNKYHSDSSPPRNLRKSEEYDEMHLRNSRKHDSKTNRNQRRCSDSDTSPPRKTPRHYGSPTMQSRKDSSRASTSRKYEQHGSLPVKSKQGGFRESNKQNKEYSLVMESASSSKHHNRSESPVRKDKHHSLPDSPARKPRGHAHSEDSFSDNSPQRNSKRPRNSSSPSRNAPKRNDSEGRRKVEDKNGHQDKGDKMKRKMEKTLDGKKAGLQAAGDLRQEISDFRRREEELFTQMSEEVSGRGAAAVMRDRKTGKCRNLEDEARQKQEKDEKMAQHKEKYAKLSKGLKQVEEQKENFQRALHEISKPLARYADDKDLDEHLRNQEHEGDPMLEYIRSKKAKDTTKSKPKYQGSFMPNRFDIPPGHRWDGVDRSNGYEKQWFERQSSRRAVEEEAYKWSTSDM